MLINKAKPFVKWAGGKGQLLSNIKLNYPDGLGTTLTKYAEPFVGGGAVLFNLLARYSLTVYISDLNKQLIDTYQSIQTNVDRLIMLLQEVEHCYLMANKEQRQQIYYQHREQFNTIKENGDPTEIASLFIFLNKTCFNGLYRVNSKGYFNVPQGSYENPVIYDKDNLQRVAALLKNATIVHGDYRLADAFIDHQTFCYIDPPYRPLSLTANFNSYTNNGFDDSEQIKLANFIKRQSQKGAKILVSNSDPHNSDEADHFFDDLYQEFTIERVAAKRNINSKANKRGTITELLVSNS